MEHNDCGFLDTRRAADYLSLSHQTLDGYRASGVRPASHCFGEAKAVVYADDAAPWPPGGRTLS